MLTSPLLALLYQTWRDVRGTYGQRTGGKKKCAYMRQRKTDSRTTDWLLGKAFCHMKTPPPCIQAMSSKPSV